MSWIENVSDYLWRSWLYLTDWRTLAIVFGVGFALLAIFLLIASRTRWGQTKPLTKCVVLSVLAHVWLLMYALGNPEILPQGNPRGSESEQAVAFEGELTAQFDDTASSIAQQMAEQQSLAQEQFDASLSDEPTVDNIQLPELQPWEQAASLADLPTPPALETLLREPNDDLQPPSLLPTLIPTPMPTLPPLNSMADETSSQPATENSDTYDSSQAVASDLSSESVESPVLPPNQVVDAGSSAESPYSRFDSTPMQREAAPSRPTMQPIASNNSPVLPPEQRIAPNPDLPAEYQLRQAPNRLQIAQAFGADADSEAAVNAGLKWLASAQSPDGSWNAKQHGAGTETYALGEYRHGTGDRADTGISGLALLAFLSAGHTHLEGNYQVEVTNGLRYLLRVQMPSGDLSGPKQIGSEASVVNARMYCHSIATLALAEAYAMTHDAALKDALIRAGRYSLKAQDPRGGGWRYRPGDSGDLSQFGWQAMALKSIERSGISIPDEVQQRMESFLDSCQTGRSGGLARYRPGEGRPSETMTAEALACRLLLDYPITADARYEASSMLIKNLPDATLAKDGNVYYWYYATLALFQLQDENWRVWNQALKARLIRTQHAPYDTDAGSWDPDGLWGGYGGRVYSTAMSCLCLEVYYRYLPMYQQSNLARTRSNDRSRR